MSRRVDILVFGATGFTGRYVIEEVARKAKQFGFTWGVGGRAVNKLKQILQETSNATGIEGLTSNVQTVAADINDKQSLIDMCSRTTVLINCVGPYRLYGEPVVSACLEARTHYVDISGEPQFLETMQLRYDSQAAERQVFIVGSCGFDSLIADLGVEKIQQECETKNIDIAFIESYLSRKSGPTTSSGLVHYATWESAIYGFSRAFELKDLRRQLFPQKLPFPKFKIGRKPVFSTVIKGKTIWAVPFPGSDKSVVQRSQYFNHTKLNKKPIRYQPYLQLPSFVAVMKLVFFRFVFETLTKFKFGINWLLKFPGLFSAGLVTKEGPNRLEMEQSSFKMTFITHGWQSEEDNNGKPDLKIIHEFLGPELSYIATSSMIVACALTLLNERDRLPVKGGVLTPANAFSRTTVMDAIAKDGIVLSRL